MENKHLTVIPGVLLLLIVICFSLSSCQDDSEALYEGYGLVQKSEDRKFSVRLDDGNLLYPRDSYLNSDKLRDSMRLYVRFNVLEETDSCAFVRITYADSLLTKSILPYSESILDSIGNDPVKITKHWFAHGFLNFEFMYAGRLNLTKPHAHMVNLLQHPSENDKLIFEFRHNDFNDYRDQLYFGVVSFPISKIIEGQEKPIKMEVKFNDSENTSRTIELIYK